MPSRTMFHAAQIKLSNAPGDDLEVGARGIQENWMVRGRYPQQEFLIGSHNPAIRL